jgi:two-component system sensor histidine kinase RpfC
VRAFEQEHGLPRLPIVALTANVFRQDRERCRDAGMDAVLTKPIEPDQLLIALAETVARSARTPAERGPFRPAVVTPIAAHPKFAPEAAEARMEDEPEEPSVPAVVDETAVEALRALGAGSDFFAEVIAAFRQDGRQIVDDICAAAIAGDVDAFRDFVHALRSSAANVGGAQLCHMLQGLNELDGGELGKRSMDIVERLQTEFDRLDAALDARVHAASRAS